MGVEGSTLQIFKGNVHKCVSACIGVCVCVRERKPSGISLPSVAMFNATPYQKVIPPYTQTCTSIP